MSNYQANIIIKNPATPTGPNANGSAPGIWRMNEVAYWIKQGVWPNANILPDTYFPYVSLLLSSTSLGNANNNLFVDSSGAFNPISRNGNATQGSFTPYGTNWSNYFASSSDYLQISGPATGTGTWTVEGWFYFTSFPGGPIFAQGTADTTSCWFLYLTSSGGLNFYSNGDISSSSAGVVPLNTWVHIALVSSSSTAKTYVNGVSVATGSYAGKVFTGGPFQLNRGYGGATSGNPCYQSNVRMVVGTAVYTANFTPPTSPLTAISGTTLLTCQSNRFRDASTNNYTVTRTGSVTVTEFAPFSPGNPGITYNQSDITNWSGYFDGSGDYLQMPSNAAFAFGTGDYTIEGWIYVTVGGLDQRITWFSDDRHNIDINTSNQIFLYDGAIRTFGTVTVGTWNHFAVSRTSGTVSCYLNGVRGYNASETTNSSTRSMNIAANNAGNGYFNGYISNIRVVKGTGVYSGATITVPTTPLTAISGTSLLTLQNAAFTDNSTNNFVITPNGNVTVTGNSPFNTVGYWSNYFDGSGDYLTLGGQSAFAFGTGDFTIEGWVYYQPSVDIQLLTDWRPASTDGLYPLLYIDASGNMVYYVSAAARITSSSMAANTWNHFALARSGTSTKLFINGVQSGSTYSDSNNYLVGASRPVIGASGYNIGTIPLNKGYLSNVRVVKGTAVYTSAFTVPTAPLTAISGTSLLTCQASRLIDSSTNNFTITRNGDVSVQSFDPFYTSTIASNGGSMYFDGSGDYLAIASNAALPTGNARYTIEAWIYPTAINTNNGVIGWGTYGTTNAVNAIKITSTQILNYWWANDLAASFTFATGQWYHIVAQFDGTTRSVYVNGTRLATDTPAGHNVPTPVTNATIGVTNSTEYFTGYISGLKVTSGAALYSGASYTVPTTPATPAAATTLLLNGMNAGIYDATAINDMETVNNVYVSTAVSKFNGSSIRFNSADYLKLPSTNELAFGTGDFTIEAWVYITANSGDWFIISSIGSGGLFFGQRAGSGWGYGRTAVAWDYNSGVNPVTNTWQHLAISRSGTSMRMFVDGTQIGTTQSSGTDYSLATGGTSVGSQGANYYLGGYIDDLRVTKGYARYTANFTPPTQAFPTY